MNRKKILINASIIDENVTGVGVYAIEVISRLVEKLNANDIDYEIYAYKNSHLNFIEDRRFKEISLNYKYKFPFVKSKAMHRLYWNFFELPAIAKNFTTVYSTSSHGGTRIKDQVITVHDLIGLQYPFQHIFQYLYFKLLLGFIVKSSRVIAISNFTKAKVVSQYKPRKATNVIYNGCNHLKHNPTGDNPQELLAKIGIKCNEKYFLTVGAAYPHKNIHRLIDAMNVLNNDEVKLVIVGKAGAYFTSLQKKIDFLKAKNIILLNYVSNELLSALYKNSFALVYVSLYEGFGFPPLEAAVHGKVSIISNSSCLPEIYGSTAIYVNPNSTESITNALLNVVNCEALLKDKVKYLPMLVKKYDWDKTVSQISHLLGISS